MSASGVEEDLEGIPIECPSCKKFRNPVSEAELCGSGSDNNDDGVLKRNNSLTSKLTHSKQTFNGDQSPSCEKKGLLQRMHSLSLIKTKEKPQNAVSDPTEFCQCNDSGENWYRTWPERGREREKKSPTKANKATPDTENDSNNGVNSNIILNQLPIAYDPVTKKLMLIKELPTKELPTNESPSSEVPAHKLQPHELKPHELPTQELPIQDLGTNKKFHKRQPSVLSTDSDVQLPLHSNRYSRTSLSSLSNYSSSTDQTNSLERSAEPPRFGLASLWQRAFNRKSEIKSEPAMVPWNLFTRSSFFQKSTSGRSSSSSTNGATSPTCTLKKVGSSGLILHSRPSFLPAKCPQEELHHQLLHNKLLEESQRREHVKLMEADRRQEEISRQEEQMMQATKMWLTEILPEWESSKKWRKTREIWWQGLPPCVRGQVWKLSIGNDLNVTADLYLMCLERAKEKLTHSQGVGLEDSVDVIKLDLSRTFPHLAIFQDGGPFHQVLGDLLSAYVCFRPDIGYVQGMSFLGAILLLNLDVADAFITFANLLNRPLLHAFFRLDQPKMAEFYCDFESLLKCHLPKVHSHFQMLDLSPDLYLQDWIYTLYSRSLPLDLASRVWDLYCRDGQDFIFRAALGILKLYEYDLLELDFINAAQLLTKLPEDIDGLKLFRAIEQLNWPTEKSRFSQILTHHLAKVKGH